MRMKSVLWERSSPSLDSSCWTTSFSVVKVGVVVFGLEVVSWIRACKACDISCSVTILISSALSFSLSPLFGGVTLCATTLLYSKA